ncbi:hypothetical protein JX265_009065 [Neoarthrinium moseri]|uniref:NAD dependent epimerase/dehydratase n=1 Tax=Neoarthrinium moseri TaxID=1658444 RepID=A0A9P9WGR2_9PEZI|nr:uncharacterized protein JN550_011450 [Neoarthrinium moseri]KAI1846632.1 hypothetical protein JX266_007205 [Neoarthrinium moseri]KAI1860602.1 hypothetical protein JN550_011450 [Neoarthrinium moseri]KAI1863019.1 hypothetical protein JX265_009065 [Neoarthrinium moseri]
MEKSVSISSRPFIICCGLPRTGTTSLGKALSILLEGPVFDGGGQSFRGNRHEQRQMLELASHVPAKEAHERELVLNSLAKLTAGCVASVDQPGCYMIEELLRLYPDATVICTIRDRESWWASYSELWKCIHELYPLSWLSPWLHRFCRFSLQIWESVPPAVGIPSAPAWPMDNHACLYEAHAEYVRRVVPKERLHYFDVRHGWQPLCKILRVPDPEIPFPHELPRMALTRGKEDLMKDLRRRRNILVGLGFLIGIFTVYQSASFMACHARQILA